MGGEVLNPVLATLDSIEVMPAGGSWRTAEKLPLPLHGVAAASVDGALYILGGSERAGAILNHGRAFLRKE
jgi:N-acetylneuraminic acid mutarotase